ncbi:MAG: hypothetical protein GY868_09060, partial [Deltaproteobacteria bacterium]|nr:hypothetical protein [Deltaproteobacteria bacterium]
MHQRCKVYFKTLLVILALVPLLGLGTLTSAQASTGNPKAQALLQGLLKNTEYDPDNPVDKLECFADTFINELKDLEQCEEEPICIATNISEMVIGFLKCIG